ncbi:hypothetical protein Ahy_A10g050928 [Arachis hypogaea]|uniref:Uncharacterized protein n=1 Tax=Arachis hypogaea TaxID=3818 RepID=A0A445BAX4_ARAHY|nr:hypothetical protein Ahy_A10g050928 [Arachis hypogaea]
MKMTLSKCWVLPLKWDVKLAKEAQKLLNKLIRSQALTTARILCGIGDPIPLWEQKRWLAWWIADKKYYDRKSNSCISGDCKCYTKCNKCQMRCIRVVCLYGPERNVDGVRPY